jgi:AcrR family transcriptional regulator
MPPGAKRYLEQAMRMIDRSGGSHGVNLREVARALGHSHTNAYNFFRDRDELLLHALDLAMEAQVERARAALTRRGSALARLDALIEAQVAFALEHPGWYRFLWMEPLPGATPPKAAASMTEAGTALRALLREASAKPLTPTQARQCAEDFHNGLHGALCKALAGRGVASEGALLRKHLTREARRFLRQLLRVR